jgi:pantothenate kinase
MLTRETALARLRTAGTLAAGKKRLNVITRAQATDATARAIQRIVAMDGYHDGGRLLAPAAAQGVLP